MRNKSALLFLSLLLSATITSCAPTYPREKVIDGVKSLCKKEYGVEVNVKIVGKTLGVYIPLSDLFDVNSMQISQKALEKIDGVMLSVSRVALSTDKSIEFYIVITAVKNVPGAEVVLTRYVYDLHRYVFGDISRGEFTKRMVFDVRFNPQGIIDTWLGEFTLKEIKLDEFICQQATRRITEEFRDNKQLAGKFKISACEGSLQERVFKFTVDINREGLPMSELIHGTAWRDKILELCLQQISHVIYIYDFKDFDKVEVYNKFDSKIKTIDKNRINQLRKRRVEIE